MHLLTSNQYWDGNTTIEGNLKIPRGKILKLAADARVLIPDGNKITIVGEIFSEGTSGHEVVFSPDGNGSDTSSGQWDGIIIDGISTQLNYAIIKYATNAIDMTNSVASKLSNVTIINHLNMWNYQIIPYKKCKSSVTQSNQKVYILTYSK